MGSGVGGIRTRRAGRRVVVALLGGAALVGGAPTFSAASATAAPAITAAAPSLDTVTATRLVRAALSEVAGGVGAAAPLVTIVRRNGVPVFRRHAAASLHDAVAAVRADSRDGQVEAVTAEQRYRTTSGTDDRLSAQQWAFDHSDFPSSWRAADGSGVVVAVVDSGVRADHEDLGGRLLAGRTFIDGSGGQNGVPGADDDFGHGTHVSGIIAANANNGIGIAGAAPGVQILPLKVLDATGECADSDVATAIVYAASHGAGVINLSLGGPGDSRSLHTAILFARSRGVVVVASAGNNGADTNEIEYPAAYPEVVAVSAVDANLERASFSTHQPYVALAAPGVRIESLGWTAPNAYRFMSGTSMAAPFVSAAAALVRAEHPTATADDVVATLESTALHLGSTGRNADYGFGLVDPVAALMGVREPAVPPPPPVPGGPPPVQGIIGPSGPVTVEHGALVPIPTSAPPGSHPVAVTQSGSRQGSWVATSDGGVAVTGDAGFYGSMGGLHLNMPVQGMTVTPTGGGYWLVASDGGIFAFGDATFFGSMGGRRLNQPIVGMAATPTGRGYWLVAADGGIFAFGDATFLGSTGALRLNAPIVAMVPTPSGQGYWFVAHDGGVFSFGDAPFQGSTGGLGLRNVVGMLPAGDGYYVATADGAVYTFGHI